MWCALVNSKAEKISPTSNHDAGRRAWLAGALWLGAAGAIGAAQTALPAARSLRDELTLALRGGNPLVVMVSLDGCPFCKTARDHYLSPLREQQGLPVVQVDMRSAAGVQDFKGAAFTHDALVRAWNVTLAPTVLFFGHDGAEVAPRLRGAGSRDYYGTLLEQRLAQARAALKRP